MWEIAQQLRQAGETVSLLALLDTNAPGYPPRRTWLVRAWLHAWHARQLGIAGAARYVGRRAGYQITRLAARPHDLFERDSRVRETELGNTMQASADAMLGASGRYAARKYDGRVVLIAAAHRPYGPGVDDSDPLLGWATLAGRGVERRNLSCQHLRMLDAEHSVTLARILTDCLGTDSQQT